MKRSASLAVAILTLCGVALVSAPANASSPTTAATSPRPIVTIGMQGGFVAPSWQASRLPQLVLYSNGIIYAENPKPTHGYVREMLQSRVTASVAAGFAAQIYGLTQTPKGGWGMPPVADVPDTTIAVTSAGHSRKLAVFALNFTGPNLPAVQANARTKLAAAISKFQASATKLAHGQTLKPSVYEVWGLTQLISSGNPTGGMVGMANPASVYCQSIGGTSGTIATDAGEAGTCQLPNGTTVDEWVNYRSALATLPQWPAGYTVPQADYNSPNLGCTVIAASELTKQLANKADDGRWLLSSGQAFPVVLRPALPGESPCHRNW